jgi:hypothetical protein
MQGDWTLMNAKPGYRMPSSMMVASPAMSAGVPCATKRAP